MNMEEVNLIANDKKSKTWSRRETADFINLAKERRLFDDIHSKCRNKKIFQLIKEDMDKLGYEDTLMQLRRKWKTLKGHYYRMLSHTSRSVQWCHFAAMHEILGTSPKARFLQSRFGYVTIPDAGSDAKVKEESLADEMNIFPTLQDNTPAYDSSQDTTDTESDTSMEDNARSLPSSGSYKEVPDRTSPSLLYWMNAQNIQKYLSGLAERPKKAFERPYQKDQEHQPNDAWDRNILLQMEIIKMLKELTKELQKQPDRYDDFGSFIASHLRSMTEEKSHNVMKNLFESLFEND